MNWLWAAGYVAGGFAWSYLIGRVKDLRDPRWLGLVWLLWPIALTVSVGLAVLELGWLLIQLVGFGLGSLVLRSLPKPKGPVY